MEELGGVSTGGAIFVFTQLSVTGSTFLDNRAIAGSGGAGGGRYGGPGGLAEGGAIDDQATSFTIIPPPLPVSTIASSLFVGNESVGGGETAARAAMAAMAPSARGGDIVCFGYLSITSSSFLFTKALGGAGGSGGHGEAQSSSAKAATCNCSMACMTRPIRFFAVTDSVTDSTVFGTVAEGGSGGWASPSGAGGSSGCAREVGSLSATRIMFPARSRSQVSGTILAGNAAIGGAGGSGTVEKQTDGDAEGGEGIFVDPYSTVVLDGDAIIGNVADGGSAPPDGTRHWRWRVSLRHRLDAEEHDDRRELGIYQQQRRLWDVQLMGRDE